MFRTLDEEIANSVTHAIGVVLAALGLFFLLLFAVTSGDAWKIVSCSIYGTTLVVLYAASTLYHGFQRPRLKKILRIIDHSAIYLLIAGTYTPFTLVTLRGTWGWVLFGIIWGMAFCGIVFKFFWVDRFKIVSVLSYLLMGWLAVIAIKQLLVLIPIPGFLWIVAGGLFYTVGVLFYTHEQKWRYSHAIWHLFVLAGSICHYFAVLFYVVPKA